MMLNVLQMGKNSDHTLNVKFLLMPLLLKGKNRFKPENFVLVKVTFDWTKNQFFISSENF